MSYFSKGCFLWCYYCSDIDDRENGVDDDDDDNDVVVKCSSNKRDQPGQNVLQFSSRPRKLEKQVVKA